MTDHSDPGREAATRLGKVAPQPIADLHAWRADRHESLPDDDSEHSQWMRRNPALAEDVLDRLAYRYRSEPVPDCRVCGGTLTVASMGGGRNTEYACQNVPMSDPDWLSHYGRSKWTDPNHGDDDVTTLVDAVRALLDSGSWGGVPAPGDTVTTEQWAVHGDGYDHEIRHRLDALTCVLIRPEARTLERRVITTTIGPWETMNPDDVEADL